MTKCCKSVFNSSCVRMCVCVTCVCKKHIKTCAHAYVCIYLSSGGPLDLTATTKRTLTQKRQEFAELFHACVVGLPQKLILNVTLPKAVSMRFAVPQLKNKIKT